ncbi:HutD/Ves family protein [Cohaesibacter gelatinilyticus]|uniref:HutD protein n=1 Tax=Cohaesibacter gelatinilyticus TaxID=372072 RepID=A0A285PFY9_9HYPH|nr:HutD family protein [Cohaesibacter gelatinilyticus]SNZ20167.1 HutD protein [Cohaesibacter gelatinilyticus]
MDCIRPEQFTTTPWKNGGGITHEIAKYELDGAMLWRLSLAEVTRSGPFSIFPGLDRVLYSVGDTGMKLYFQEGSPREPLITGRLYPTCFAGDVVIDGQMEKGAKLVENFNLIYDRARLCIKASGSKEGSDWFSMLADVPEEAVIRTGQPVRHILYCLKGSIGPLAAREVGLFTHLAKTPEISQGAEAILLRLEVTGS